MHDKYGLNLKSFLLNDSFSFCPKNFTSVKTVHCTSSPNSPLKKSQESQNMYTVSCLFLTLNY